MAKNELSTLFNSGLLSEPGDKFTAYITQSGRQVIKLHKSTGHKISATRYPSTGTIVKTESNKSNT